MVNRPARALRAGYILLESKIGRCRWGEFLLETPERCAAAIKSTRAHIRGARCHRRTDFFRPRSWSSAWSLFCSIRWPWRGRRGGRDPRANLSLIWFTVWSSVVHAVIMAVQSFGGGHHMGHLAGDVPALLLVAIVLAALVVASGLKQPSERDLTRE